MGALLAGSDNGNCLPGDICHLVKRWNHRAQIGLRSDWNNYLNGDIEFLFEHVGGIGHPLTEVESCDHVMDDWHLPTQVSVCHAKRAIIEATGKIRNLGDDVIATKRCVVARWDGKPVLIDGVEIMDQIEKFIPSRITMRLQVNKRLVEAKGDPIGQSILYGFLKPCPCFAEGKLDISLLPAGGSKGGNDVPVSVIQGGPEVMRDIRRDVYSLTYDGLVFFGPRGAVTGLCVCFDNIRERSLFLEKFIKLVDVFRGPVDLGHCAI